MKNFIKAALVAVAVLALAVGWVYFMVYLAELTGGASHWVFLAASLGFVFWVSYSAFQEIDKELSEADREADDYDAKKYARERALGDLIRERTRQIESEGFTPERDADVWHGGELANAAACYALNAGTRDEASWASASLGRLLWPWGRDRWKPTTARRDLIKAGALILAELERLDSMEADRS